MGVRIVDRAEKYRVIVQRLRKSYRLLRNSCNASCSSSSRVEAGAAALRGFFRGGRTSSPTSPSESDGISNSGETYPSSSESSATVGPAAPASSSPP